jgi:hypothetical protein
VSVDLLDSATLHITPFEVRRRLVSSLILPHVNYGNIVTTGADSASQRRLGVAFKACLRYIHMRRRFDHVSHSAFVFVVFRHCMFAILLTCFRFFIFPHRCTLGTSLYPHRTLVMRRSFVVLGCRAWNFLPHDVKRLPTHGTFVAALKGIYHSA